MVRGQGERLILLCFRYFRHLLPSELMIGDLVESSTFLASPIQSQRPNGNSALEILIVEWGLAILVLDRAPSSRMQCLIVGELRLVLCLTCLNAEAEKVWQWGWYHPQVAEGLVFITTGIDLPILRPSLK